MSGEKDRVKLRFDPFDKQVPPLVSRAPITMAVAGARGGKTKVGCPRSIYEAVAQEGYYQCDIDAGLPYTMAIGAPTFPMLQRIILPTFMAMIPSQLVIGKFHQTKKLLRIRGLRGETHIYFLSGKAFESWMGMSLYRVWLDEFAQVKEELFDEINVRLLDRQGRLLLTGTPQGPNWAFKRLYKPWAEFRELSPEKQAEEMALPVERRHAGSKVDFHHWRTVDNPHVPKSFIEEKRRTMPPRFFSRTFEATWDTFAGQVYDEFLDRVHVKKRADYSFKLANGRIAGSGQNLIPLVRVSAGVDFGFAQGHAGVIIVGGQDTSGRWWLLEESVAEGVLMKAEPGVDTWEVRAMALRTKWDIDRFYCDTANPEGIRHLKRAGLKAVGAVKDVLAGIQCVSTYMHVDQDTEEPRMYVLDDLRTTIDELVYYHWKTGKDGGAGREEPEKVNDNTCDAVRYLIYTQETRGRFRREPNYVP